MKKVSRFLILCFCLIVSVLQAQQNQSVVREDFHELTLNEESLEKEYKKAAKSNQVVDKGYKAVMQTMKAEFTINPYLKWNYFKQGTASLENLIRLHPNHVELRYHRLLIQLNVPGFLDYSDDIESDIDFLLKNIKFYDVERGVKKMILLNLVKEDELDANTKEKLKEKCKVL